MLKTKDQFSAYLKLLFAYTVLVILWGAWVRISHSGDGCGDSWPLCQGQLIPDGAEKKTWVELSHRLTSGLFGIFVVYGFFASRKIFAAEDGTRRWMNWTLFFTISEALLGAKLVLSGLVMGNDSIHRVVVMALHQLNSFLLTGSIICANLALIGPSKFKTSKLRPLFSMLFLFIGITGAWAALSTTLFHSDSILEGIRQDFSNESHYLLRLRVIHPILGLLVGSSLALVFWLDAVNSKETARAKLSFQTAIIFVVAVLFGLLTLFSLSPIWMKLTHLALAHTIWLMLLRWSWLAEDKTEK